MDSESNSNSDLSSSASSTQFYHTKYQTLSFIVIGDILTTSSGLPIQHSPRTSDWQSL